MFYTYLLTNALIETKRTDFFDVLPPFLPYHAVRKYVQAQVILSYIYVAVIL